MDNYFREKENANCALYVGGTVGVNHSLAFCFGKKADDGNRTQWTSNGGAGAMATYCDDVRRTAVVDSPNKKISLVESGAEVWSQTYDTAIAGDGEAAPCPLGLFGRTKDEAGRTCDDGSRIKVYGFRIYEDGALLFDYKPAIRDGVADLYDAASGFGGRRKAVRDRLALQGGTGDFP